MNDMKKMDAQKQYAAMCEGKADELSFDDLCTFRTIVETSSSSFAFIDKDLRLVAANRKRRDELGIAETSTGRRHLADLISKPVFERKEPLLRRCLAGEALCFKEPTGDGAGEQQVHYLPSKDRDGEILGLVELRVDKSDDEVLERKLEEKERALESREAELKRLSIVDSLSGSLNRGAVLGALEEEIRRAARYGRPLAIVLFDLDHFKLVNDIHGRAAGDEAIQRFSAICRASFRNTDYVGRYSGEEFLVILPEIPIQGAIEAAARVRTALQSERFTATALSAYDAGGAPAESHEFTVTVSAGIAGLEEGMSSDQLLANADAALYRAKEKGRNRVEIAGRH